MAEQGKTAELRIRDGGIAPALLRLIRPGQWAKNTLIVAPMLLGHRLSSPEIWGPAITAFFAFSFCASALYVWNDLLDVNADQAHPRKRLRPLAAGTVTPRAAMVAMTVLLAASVGLSTLLPPATWGLLLAYAGGSICYSALLKRLTVIDVVTLAAFYTLRIFYGGAATGIKVSVWTMAFSVFLFLSLALIKRLTELRGATSKADAAVVGRSYRPEDLPVLGSLAAASGYLAALVVGLYIQSPEVQALYTKPQYLWFLMPALIYWISRALVLANRGEMDDDPVLYALRDPASYVAGACCALVAYLAT
ncbi:MAG: UbiA family prenyltransferase [Bryobacteraceae bacterium]